MDLDAVIENGTFYSIPFPQLLHLIQQAYPTELTRLIDAYSVPAPRDPSSFSDPSPSTILYSAEYDEINRTLTSIDLLRKIHNDDYEGFVGNQTPEARRLTRESFDEIRALFENGLKCSEDLVTLVTTIIINDLGKAPSLALEFEQLCRKQGGTGDAGGNHDMLLYNVTRDAPGLIPCISRMPSSHREILMRGLQLGATLNFGQVAQAESPAVSLVMLEWMRDEQRANSNKTTTPDKISNTETMRGFELRYLEQVLDVAGALGHKDHTCAALLLEPIYQSYKAVFEVSMGILDGCIGWREGYDTILSQRMGMLVQENGWKRGTTLDMQNPEHRALMRLLCMCNAAMDEGPEIAELVWSTLYNELTCDTRAALVEGLNINGEAGTPAVQATYAPAICSAAIRGSQGKTKEDQKEALAAVFRYLARVHLVSQTDAKERIISQYQGVLVLELDIRELTLPVVSSEEFQTDPSVLDGLDVPRGYCALRVPT
ncbi:hypothetical protein BDV19DRAFT_399294 [Aspergillus venezuelensis]